MGNEAWQTCLLRIPHSAIWHGGRGQFLTGQPGTIWDYTGFQPLTTWPLDASCWLLDAGGETVQFFPSPLGAQKNFYFFRPVYPRQAATSRDNGSQAATN